MKLIEFYTRLLEDVRVFDLNGDGFLSARLGDQTFPLTIEGKRLVLPTKEILRGGNWDQRICFHPMGEKLTRGESPVLKGLKDYMQVRCTVVLGHLAAELMRAAASPDMHKRMGPASARQYLKQVANADEKTYKALDQVLSKIKKDPARRLITMYLKRGGKGNEEVRRSCVVSFPIMDEFEAEGQEVFGVKMPRKTDKAIIASLFEYILGDAETRELYTVGSNNTDAPYFHALISSFYKIATRLNQLVDTHSKHVEDADDLKFKLEWAEDRDNLAMYSGLIPDQDGNEGVVIDDQARDGRQVLQERAQEAYSRPAREEPKADEGNPWDEPPARRAEPRQSREEETPPPGAKVSMRDFLDNIQNAKREEEPQWGLPRRGERGRDRDERDRPWGDGFNRDRYDSQREDRYESRMHRYDGDRRQSLRSDDRRPSRSSTRSGRTL